MSQYDIRRALVEHIEGIALGVPLSYVGQPFTPPNGELWAEVDVIFNQPVAVTIGPQGEDEHTGILQVSFYSPGDIGDGSILNLADKVRTASVCGTVAKHGTAAVTIVSCGIGPFAEEHGEVFAPVTIEWRARTHRDLRPAVTTTGTTHTHGGTKPPDHSHGQGKPPGHTHGQG